MSDLHDDKILILDYGSQYTQLIARRVREAGVYCEIYPWDVDFERIREFAAKGFILSGGPESTLDDDKPEVPMALFDLGCPFSAFVMACRRWHSNSVGAWRTSARVSSAMRACGPVVTPRCCAISRTRSTRKAMVCSMCGCRTVIESPSCRQGIQADGQHRQCADRRYRR